MRWAVGVLIIGVLIGGARAEDETRQVRTVGDAVRASVRAFDARDAEALRRVAGTRGPDPWLVVDELHHGGRLDVARAYAAEVTGPVAYGLGAYVDSCGGRNADETARTAVATGFAALRAGEWQRALEATKGIEAPLDSAVRIEAVFARAHALRRLGRLEESAATFDEAAEAARAVGWRTKEGLCYRHAAKSASQDGDWQGKLDRSDLARRAYEAVGDRVAVAQATSHMSLACLRLAREAEALDLAEEVLREYETLGHGPGIVDALYSIGQVHAEFGRPREARLHTRRGLEVAEEVGPPALTARGLANLGGIEVQLGRYERALTALTRALKLTRDAGNRAGVGSILGNIGSVHFLCGDYSRAHAVFRDALAAAREAGSVRGTAIALDNLGNLHARLGQPDVALEHYTQALLFAERAGDGPFTAGLLGRMGSALTGLDRHEEAEECFRRALAAARTLGDPTRLVIALLDLGEELAVQGKKEAAVTTLDRAVEVSKEITNPRILAGVHAMLGHLLEGHGEKAGALREYELSLTHLQTAPSPYTRAHSLAGMARIHLSRGEAGRAVELARDAVAHVADIFSRLGEEEGARAKDAYAELFAVGLGAAARTGDSASVLFFLERGRAGALREGLGARQALAATLVSAEVREELAVAREAKRRALEVERAAARSGRRRELAVARRARGEAEAAHHVAIARLQRETKRAAALVLPRPDDLPSIQRRLGGGDALVYFGRTSETMIALVVWSAGARLVDLGATALVDDAAAAFMLDEHPYVDPEQLAPLRRLVCDPLELERDVRRVLVCPVGRLSYVPFAMLLPDREVTYVPSGTTYGLLSSEGAGRGEGVLAIGDPAYGTIGESAASVHRGRSPGRLVRLPATRVEAEAVGTDTLLGADATESVLARTLDLRERWRAVHLACHGLVDPDRPLLSSLALTPDRENDGLLTCLEILRLRVPADLVVLSACETARGRIYETEGVLGLPRAFMFSGSPRVLCSLWQVDDEATQALMVKFYELWNPKSGAKGESTATALKEAQAFVANHDRWKHPYFWAAWVLWGLPD